MIVYSCRESSVVNRSTPVPQSGLSGGSAGAGTSAGAGPGRPSSTSGDTTLTAASVIDAIITHTINEGVPSSNANHPRHPPLTSRLGDRLFEVLCYKINSAFSSLVSFWHTSMNKY